ncbi:MAG: energy transducer TonB [bacterium]
MNAASIYFKEVMLNENIIEYLFKMKYNNTKMTPMKKALIISIGLHLAGLLGGEFFLWRSRLKNNKIIYPIRLIEIAESSPKPKVVKLPPKKQERTVKQAEKPKPKVVKKKVQQKPLEPKKGVPVKKETPPVKKEQKEVNEEANKQAIKKDEEKKISQAIEEIKRKRALAVKEKEEYSEESKKFIERQLQIYAAKIYHLIKSNWTIQTFSKDMENIEAILVIRLNPNGELADVRLEKTSGFNHYDESIIRAIKKTAPFPPPPLDLKEEELEFEVRFHPDEMG